MSESAILVEIERVTETWGELMAEPDEFYVIFAIYLDDFNYIYNPEYHYFGYLKGWSRLIEDFYFTGYSIDEISEHLKEYSFEYYQSFFKSFKPYAKKCLQRHRENEVRNTRSMKAKVYTALQKYSKSLVVRVDLAYDRQYQDRVWIEDFHSDIEILRNEISLRNKPFHNLVGYAWALEQGEIKGYHCHLLLIFNGHTRHRGWGIAKEVGLIWKEITNGLGNYFNCHDPKQIRTYEEKGILGIEMIYRRDIDAVERVIQAAGYLVRSDKENQYLRVKPILKMRTFGQSNFL